MSYLKKGKRSSSSRTKLNRNEKLTVDWVVLESRKGKPIFTDLCLTTLGSDGLKKVVVELEKMKILTFTDYVDKEVVFIEKNNNNLTISDDNNWLWGFIKNNNNIMFLPITPKIS